MNLSFSFGGNTGQTYDELQRKRAFAEALMLRGMNGQPKTAIEGINSAANSILGALIAKRAGKDEAAGRDAFNSQFSDLFGNMGRGPESVVSAPKTASAFTTPNPGNLPQATIDAVDRVSPNIPHDFSKIEAAYGLPKGYLAQVAMVESGGNPNAKNPNSSAGGMFQFIDSTAQQYGLENKFDPMAAADAAARLAADNRAALIRALGREPTAGELYLAHQQGAGGAAALLSNPNAPAASLVGSAAVNLNGGDAGMTAGQFADQWTGKIIEAMGSPYASPEQKSALSALLQQKIAGQDPMRALELEKAQLEVDALRNPQAAAQEAPASFLALDMQARAAGYEPGTPEYQEWMRNGGGSGVPAAFMALDMQARAAGFEPGTPEYQEFMATRGAGFIAEAKARGEDTATLDSLSSKMPGLEEVVKTLDDLSEKATYTLAGRALDTARKEAGLEPRESAIARAEYTAIVDNQILPLLRDTFGAQFTQKEGETLKNTLGDPNKSPKEKQAVLRAFIEQKRRDIEGLKTRTEIQGGTSSGGSTYTFNPETGELE